MQDTINRGNARPFKLTDGRMPGFLAPVLLFVVLAMARGTSAAQTVSQPGNAATPSEAQKVFDAMKTLAGSWQGTIMGIPIDATIRLTSSGTAILYEANTEKAGPPKHEITMFYVDGDRMLATHFCDAGNRARLEGKVAADGKASEFTFIDVAGSTRGGLVKRMVFTMVDANKHIVELTFVRPDGKPMELRGEFARTK